MELGVEIVQLVTCLLLYGTVDRDSFWWAAGRVWRYNLSRVHLWTQATSAMQGDFRGLCESARWVRSGCSGAMATLEFFEALALRVLRVSQGELYIPFNPWERSRDSEPFPRYLCSGIGS